MKTAAAGVKRSFASMATDWEGAHQEQDQDRGREQEQEQVPIRQSPYANRSNGKVGSSQEPSPPVPGLLSAIGTV